MRRVPRRDRASARARRSARPGAAHPHRHDVDRRDAARLRLDDRSRPRGQGRSAHPRGARAREAGADRPRDRRREPARAACPAPTATTTAAPSSSSARLPDLHRPAAVAHARHSATCATKRRAAVVRALARFRDHPSAPALNSDTRGTLTVYSGSDATPVTKEAVAVVFAAGGALPGQARDDEPGAVQHDRQARARGTAAPQTISTPLEHSATPRQPDLTSPRPPAESSTTSSPCVVTADFMPLVEQRVALEARNALLAYRAASACACYPWADGGADGVSDAGHEPRRAYRPSSALPQAGSPACFPPISRANEWPRVIHYAVGRGALETAARAARRAPTRASRSTARAATTSCC